MNRCILPLTALLVSFAGPARADVAPPPPEDCPPGSFIQTLCGGSFCHASECQSDADCHDGAVCQCAKACISLHDGFDPPAPVHGGPCSPDDVCDKPEETCQAIKLCLPPGGGTTSGTGGEVPVCPGTSGGTTGTSTGTSTSDGTSTGSSSSTTAAAPTSGAVDGTTSSGGSAGSSSSDTAGGSGHGDKAGCSACSLIDGSQGLLVVVALAAVRRRRLKP